MDKIKECFYAKTFNTGLTVLVFCVMTQRGEPALFIYVEGIRREVPDLYAQYLTKGIPYCQDKVIGIAAAKRIIEKHSLTSFSRMITFS